MSMDPQPVTDLNYPNELLSQEWVLVDFWAPWCTTCMQFEPIYKEVSAMFEGRVKFLTANADETGELCQSLGISALPTIVLFRNGEEIFREGPLYKEKLVSLITGHLERSGNAV